MFARISLTLSHHPSLSSIASGRSSRQHPVSVQSCCRLVLADRPTLARLSEGGPSENVAHEFVLAPPAISHMSYSSNLDNLRDGW